MTDIPKDEIEAAAQKLMFAYNTKPDYARCVAEFALRAAAAARNGLEPVVDGCPDNAVLAGMLEAERQEGARNRYLDGIDGLRFPPIFPSASALVEKVREGSYGGGDGPVPRFYLFEHSHSKAAALIDDAYQELRVRLAKAEVERDAAIAERDEARKGYADLMLRLTECRNEWTEMQRWTAARKMEADGWRAEADKARHRLVKGCAEEACPYLVQERARAEKAERCLARAKEALAGGRRKLATYHGLFKDDKELTRLLSEWDAILAKTEKLL